MVGIIDPTRVEVKPAIAEARRAGVRTIMITGDHPLTVARIASDLGVIERGGPKGCRGLAEGQILRHQ